MSREAEPQPADEADVAVSVPRSFTIRRPRQERSRQRFEAILDAAEVLLETLEPHEVSIYTLADAAGMAAPSVYHFFPDAQHVFVALAERYFDTFAGAFDDAAPAGLGSWMEVSDYRWEASRRFYNSHAAARKILLGSGMASEMRARDLDFDRVVAAKAVDEFYRTYILPEIPGFVDRMTEMIVINDAIWSLSVHSHGIITDEAAEQARRARTAYGRTFLPEYLVRRAAD